MPIANNFPNAAAGAMFTEAVDRYNIPTVTRKVVGDFVTGDIFPKTWTAITAGTKYQSDDGYVITTSSSWSTTSNTANLAVDGSDSTYWSPVKSSTVQNHTWTIELPEAKKIRQVYLNIYQGGTPDIRSITIKGSTNGTNYITLASLGTSYSGNAILDNIDYYKFYQVVINGDSSVGLGIKTFNCVEYWDEQGGYIYPHKLTIPFDEYEINKIINIEGSVYEDVTTFVNPSLNINELGAKLINGTITAGEKYSLIYNGESWDPVVNTNVVLDYTVPSDVYSVTLEGLDLKKDFIYDLYVINGSGYTRQQSYYFYCRPNGSSTQVKIENGSNQGYFYVASQYGYQNHTEFMYNWYNGAGVISFHSTMQYSNNNLVTEQFGRVVSSDSDNLESLTIWYGNYEVATDRIHAGTRFIIMKRYGGILPTIP